MDDKHTAAGIDRGVNLASLLNLVFRCQADSPIASGRRLWTVAALTLLQLVFFINAAELAALQLPQETRDVFQELVPKLDDDLADLMRQAIREQDPVVEFTPEQFKRFRENKANPFAGLDQIDADALSGNIALKFELPTPRNRSLGKLERQSQEVLDEFAPAVELVKQSVVRIQREEEQIALGTILTQDGYILTKSSQLGAGGKELTCELWNGERRQAIFIGSEPKNDLAILKIDGRSLTPAKFDSKTAAPGAFVITPDCQSPVALGVYSTEARSLLPENPAYLGLRPIDTSAGVQVESITPFGAAEAAGLRQGDYLVKLNGQPLEDVTELITMIRQQTPGQEITIEYRRNDAIASTTAKLNGRSRTLPSGPAQTKQHGAELSKRSDRFPLVFQHDSPLMPEQCGGPLVDLDGNILGINIARHGRIGCYAIPSAHVKQVIDQLMRRDVASRDSDLDR